MRETNLRITATLFVCAIFGAAILAPLFTTTPEPTPAHQTLQQAALPWEDDLPRITDRRHLAVSHAYSGDHHSQYIFSDPQRARIWKIQDQEDRLPSRSQKEIDDRLPARSQKEADNRLPARSQKEADDQPPAISSNQAADQRLDLNEAEIDRQLRDSANKSDFLQPYLKIETGQHSGPIRTMSVDAAGKYLVTGSWDKTARVWRIPSKPGEEFELTQIIRVPIQQGDGGKVYAVAISPDGSQVAVGGRTASGRQRDLSVYIFDRKSGKLMHRLSSLPNVTLSLEFSPDGDVLVAGFADNKQRIRAVAWRVDDWSVFHEFRSEWRDRRDNIYGLDFDETGRLAIASKNGSVSIYERTSSGFRKKQAAFPFSDAECTTCQYVEESDVRPLLDVEFSPSGNQVAVGAYDAPHVAILDTETLMTLAELDVEGVDPRDNLSIFAWSQNGQRLYAGGRARRERSDFFVRVFDTFQNILVKDVVVSTSTIEGLATLGDGRVLFASADPRIGIFDDELALGSSVKSRISDLRLTPRERRQNIAGLELSENGESIRWRPSAFHEKTRLSYSIQRRRVSKAIESAPEDNFYSVLTSTPEISIDKWIDDYRTTMNDKVLEELYDFEQARAVAIAPVSQSSIILGSDFRLRKFDASGALNWEREAPGTVWQLNYTRDEKIVVAAFSDGTIRWYDSDDGDERLALFVSDADIEPLWIAWTPAGYYDASPGAEDLIGWHINQGKDREALFFSASRFRDLYYRPDLTRKALDGSEPAPRPDREALLAAAPPIITILGHRALPNGDVVVDYEATTIFGEPVEIDLFVDNAKVDLKGARSETLAGELQSITVPKGGCAKTAIALIGRTADGRASDAALVNRAALIGAVCDPADAPKPNLYALLIGVSDYANDNLDLNFAHRDAEQFAAFLQEQEGRAFEKVSIKVLSKKETTGKQQIEEALAELELAASDDDVSILFFAGHGVKSERLKDLFFLVRDTELDKLSTTAIDFTRFLTAIRRANGKRFVFLDACFSAFKGEGSLSLFDMNELSNTLGGSDVRVEVFTSSTGDQRSYEHPDWGNGAFTEAILELFRNKLEVAPIPESEVFLEAYRFDGRVTNDELESWIKHRVPVLTQDRQTPTHTGAGSTPYMIAEVD